MRCDKCKETAVFTSPTRCKNHFNTYFEKQVKKCIQTYNLIPKTGKVCVAASGGKDSLTVLHILNKLYPGRVEALVIDEGIRGYRPNTIKDLERFCNKYHIKLQKVSYKEEMGKSLDRIMKQRKTGLTSCSICGTMRRYLINKFSNGYAVLATGHNLDDEAQVVLMNLTKNQMAQHARLGPRSGISLWKGFTPRIKPLYLVTEKEVMAYSLLNGLTAQFVECPYAGEAYRNEIRDLLNEMEVKHPGTKRNLIKTFLKQLPALRQQFASGNPLYCQCCGEPTSQEVCHACRLKERLCT